MTDKDQIESKRLCDECKTNSIDEQYRIGVLTYYHNKMSSIYYFCGSECLNKYKTKNCCHYCNYNQDLTEKDGKMFCDKSYETITCLQRYVGNYDCDFCKQTQNANYDALYILCPSYDNEHSEDGKKFMCESCFEPRYNKMFGDNYKNLHDSYVYEQFQGDYRYMIVIHDSCNKLLGTTEFFVCNECQNTRCVSDGIYICKNKFDSLNLCKECFEHS